MKRRYLVDAAAALAALVSTALCQGEVEAAPPSHTKFSISDSKVAPATSNRFVANANSRSALTNTNTTNTNTDALQGDCDTCDACDDCVDCGPSPWFAEAEGLYWWRKSRPVPPLVTTNIGNVAQGQAGVLTTGTTQVLFGQDNYTDGPQAGGRGTIGRWFGEERCFAIAGSFYALGQDKTSFSRDATNANEVLALPYFSVGQVTPAEEALLINFPGVSTNGHVDVQASNDVLGVDVYGRYVMWEEMSFRLDALGGYQFSRIDDSLRIHANYDDVAGIPNSNFDVTDIFDVRNEFHGGTVGFLAQAYKGRMTITAMGKVGLGNMRQTVNIHGQTIATPVGGGAAAVTPQGLYALGTNTGTYTNDEFGILPEGKLNITYQINNNWAAGVGYSFLYWNNVVTAGSTLDRNLNLTQIPGPLVGPAQPDFAFGQRRDFWAQGLNFTLQFAY